MNNLYGSESLGGSISGWCGLGSGSWGSFSGGGLCLGLFSLGRRSLLSLRGSSDLGSGGWSFSGSGLSSVSSRGFNDLRLLGSFNLFDRGSSSLDLSLLNRS